jgi:6-pyruvoyltetrahydropterin/6-carboxytetrahydropterin synthase
MDYDENDRGFFNATDKPRGLTMAIDGVKLISVSITRYHDFSYGHRVYGHESKCACLHGHNGRAYFKVSAPGLDHIGRVIDFGVVKSTLCGWLETNWDHRTLIWHGDPWLAGLQAIDPSIVPVPFIPTAENMAMHLLNNVGPHMLQGTGVKLQSVRIDETRKCSAEAALEQF